MKIIKTILIVILFMVIFIILAKMFIENRGINEILHWGFMISLVLVNLYGFLMMVLDKIKASKAHKHRISERHLLAISALGGSLGTLIAMSMVRHKTRHLQFTVIIPIIFLSECFTVFIFYFYS